MRKLVSLKQAAFVGLCIAIGSVAMAADDSALVTSLGLIETGVKSTTATTTPSVVNIVGYVFLAVITVTAIKRMLYSGK